MYIDLKFNSSHFRVSGAPDKVLPYNGVACTDNTVKN